MLSPITHTRCYCWFIVDVYKIGMGCVVAMIRLFLYDYACAHCGLNFKDYSMLLLLFYPVPYPCLVLTAQGKQGPKYSVSWKSHGILYQHVYSLILKIKYILIFVMKLSNFYFGTKRVCQVRFACKTVANH